ncbi:MAG: hypothetical protein ABI887_18805 [Burkholderiales bacterium]
MQLLAHTPLPLSAALERDAVEAIAPGVAGLLAPLTEAGAPRDRIGLFVVSSNAGAPTSLRFWAEAQRTGLALASPELFPWCLANAPCGALSRQLGITGPNFTFLGGTSALLDATEAAGDLLHTGRIDLALIVRLDFADATHQSARGVAFVAGPGASDARAALAELPPGAGIWP